jgi:DNA helicase II / ATP-dependent DNA helicase PcrA
MRQPTREQKAVLANLSRVRVVRSAPGSGKTWLVAELIRQELEKWPSQTSGIAALSFTRVGGDEIRKAVGHDLVHPHFVGTIDSFLFRYVIRPFLHHCFPKFANPRLIPGGWGAEHWCNYGRGQKATVGQGINLFGCVCINEDPGGLVVAHKPHPALPLQRLNSSDLSLVKEAKKKIWMQTGWLTHSDAAYLAYKVLDHRTFGAAVRAEIVRRFPLLIVDELQDTGYFLGKSIFLLLGEAAVRGVLVGDPDQAIYEFNGARPDLFNDYESIEGADSLQLSSSLRCTPAIATAAGHLKDSGGTIGPWQDKPGRAFLVYYSDMVADIPRMLDAITVARNNESLKVITRLTSTVEALTRLRAKPAPKLGCPPLNHIHRAVTLFRQGRQIGALASVRAAIELAVFDFEGLNDEQLTEYRIDLHEWKALAVRCLLRTNGIATTGNQLDWLTQAGKIIDEELSKFGLDRSLQFVAGKLKPQKRKDYDKTSADFLPTLSAKEPFLVDVPVQTVHSVKGETHDITVFVCPNVKNANRCPSTVWWSADEKDREEKRIAYVAMTRTQGDLIVCISDACYQRFINDRPEFLANFECMTVDEHIAALIAIGEVAESCLSTSI